jgi:hypothetical protein
MTQAKPFESTEISPGVFAPIRRCRSEWVGILRTNGGFRVVAVGPIAAGTRLFRIDGEQTQHPRRHSLQIGENMHVDLGDDHGEDEIFDRYFWRFLNHGCEPNTVIRDLEVIAMRNIPPWADVTFDYNTTEYDMAEAFDCHCRSPVCHGTIRGFRHLTDAQRERLRPMLAPYLLDLLDRRVASATA